MKKLISLILSVMLFGSTAVADTCGAALVGVFTPAQAVKLCKSFGSAVNSSLIPAADNTYDVGSSTYGWRTGYFDTSVISPLIQSSAGLQVKVDADAQRLFTFDASSDTALTLTFGDGGTTATQDLSINPSTSDADDDSRIILNFGSSGRGGSAILYGNETSSKGDVFLGAGDASGSDVIVALNASDSAMVIRDSSAAAFVTFNQTNGPTMATGYNIRLAAAVPTMAATPVAGTNLIYPGLNVIPTAAADTAAMFAATPVVGVQYQIFNSGPNTVRIKGGGATTLNGATAGGYIAMATLTNAYCVVTSASNINCSVAPAPTPAGP